MKCGLQKNTILVIVDTTLRRRRERGYTEEGVYKLMMIGPLQSSDKLFVVAM
jgi:hypothetical protein